MSVFSWTITMPYRGLPAPALPSFPSTGSPAAGTCDGVFHDQVYFLGLIDRVMDNGYLAPMQAAIGGGYEVYQGYAKVGERVSQAIERLECGSFIIFATGGSFATGVVEFLRPTGAAGSVTVRAGSIVSTRNGNREFVTLEDAVFVGAALGPVAVPVRAVAMGWEWNVAGRVVTAGNEMLAGEINLCIKLLQTPNYGDASIVVQQVVSTSGGAAPMLDGLGEDRALPRAPGELDPAYRQRLRTLPDTVSPAAIVRFLDLSLTSLPLGYDFIETWEPGYQSCWDAPTSLPANPAYNGNLFVYDDPRPNPPFRNRWLDEVEFRGAFIVVVDVPAPIRETGLAYDDPALTPTQLRSVLGGRSTPAYDVPVNFTASPMGAYDGTDLGRQALFAGLWSALQDIKAGGVAAVVELAGQ